jgi:peptidyl-prolyl cis-trans isomerase SurA
VIVRTSLLVFALVVAASAPAVAQQDSGFVLVDRVAAVVGDTPIPYSKVMEEFNLRIVEMQRSGQPVPDDSASRAQLQREVLDQLIDDELLVQQATRDTTVKVTDQQIQSSTDIAVRQLRSRFPSDAEFRRQLQIAGLGTPEEYRRFVAEQVRRDLLKQQFIQRLRERRDIRTVPPTDQEIRDYYESTKAQQPKRPATVSFRAVFVRPEPTDSAKAVARRRADSVLVALRAGADFATVAKRFSDDVSTRDDGGDLGWFRRGRMVPEFEAAAFQLRPGQVSNVVETPFGYHLIQVLRVEPAEVHARHILFAPAITDSNIAAAERRARAAVEALRAGTPVDSVVREYHDPLDQSLFEDVDPAALPASLRTAVEGALPGDIIGPVRVDEDGRVRFAAILFVGARPEGEYTYDELKDRIRGVLVEQSDVRQYLVELRRAIYVDIRM